MNTPIAPGVPSVAPRLTRLLVLLIGLYTLTCSGTTWSSKPSGQRDGPGDFSARYLAQSFSGNRALRVNGYRRANTLLRGVYRKTKQTTLYCGCTFDPQTKRAPMQQCSFRPDERQRDKSKLLYYKVHWEHVVPAARLGRRDCWSGSACSRKSGAQYGGRACCRRIDPEFRAMEADLHNLFPAIGEINRHRKNYEFGPIPGELRQYGDCDMEISVGDRIAEPPESARGRIARAYLYMETAYGIGLTGKERKLYLGWHRSYPPDHEERVRSDFIKDLQGNDNPFVHGYGLQEDPNFSRPGACLLQ